jgi:hypothetical protein
MPYENSTGSQIFRKTAIFSENIKAMLIIHQHGFMLFVFVIKSLCITMKFQFCVLPFLSV